MEGLSRRRVLVGASAAALAVGVGGAVAPGASAQSFGFLGAGSSGGSLGAGSSGGGEVVAGLPPGVKKELRRLADARRVVGCSVAAVTRVGRCSRMRGGARGRVVR